MKKMQFWVEAYFWD